MMDIGHWQALSCCEVQILLRHDFLEVLANFPHELDRCIRLANKVWPSNPLEGPQVTVLGNHLRARNHAFALSRNLVCYVC